MAHYTGVYGEAWAINDRGQIVGDVDLTGDQESHCALWYKSQFTDLGSLGGPACQARYVTAHGLADGTAWLSDGVTTRGWMWQGGPLTVLDPYPGDSMSEANGSGDPNLVLGDSGTGSFPPVRAMLWIGTTGVDLNTLIPAGSGWSLWTATTMNARGQIVGTGVINGRNHAYVLTPTRGVASALAGLAHGTPSASIRSFGAPHVSNAPSLPFARWMRSS